jgi:hypothetical protein
VERVQGGVDSCRDGTNAHCKRIWIGYLFVSMELMRELVLTADMRSGQSDSWRHLFKLQRQSVLVRKSRLLYVVGRESLQLWVLELSGWICRSCWILAIGLKEVHRS